MNTGKPSPEEKEGPKKDCEKNTMQEISCKIFTVLPSFFIFFNDTKSRLTARIQGNVITVYGIEVPIKNDSGVTVYVPDKKMERLLDSPGFEMGIKTAILNAQCLANQDLYGVALTDAWIFKQPAK